MNKTHSQFNVRSTNDEELLLEGTALKFDTWTTLFSTDNYEVREMIKKGAIDNTAFKNTVYNKNHSDNLIFARTSNQSLKCEVVENGVSIQARLLKTSSGRDHYQEVKSGLLDKMSFRWKTKNEEATQTTEETSDGKTTISRVITKISEIDDVSAVVFPAYQDTEIYARAKDNSNKYVSRETLNGSAKERQKITEKREKLNAEFKEIQKLYRR